MVLKDSGTWRHRWQFEMFLTKHDPDLLTFYGARQQKDRISRE